MQLVCVCREDAAWYVQCAPMQGCGHSDPLETIEERPERWRTAGAILGWWDQTMVLEGTGPNL